MMNSPQTWGPEDLDDPDDPMLATDGPCAIDGTAVGADGVCAKGHDDLDRADAAEALTRLLAAGAVGVVDVTVPDVSER